MGSVWVRFGFKWVDLGLLCVKKTDTFGVGGVRTLFAHNDFWFERFLQKLGLFCTF